MNDPVPRRVPDVQAELSRAALDSAPYAMFVCTDDGMLERMNTAFTRLTDYPPADLLGKRSFLSLLDPSELARRRLPALASLSGDEAVPYDDEWHLLTHMRSWLPIRLALSCIEHAPGERRWVGIVLDLSQQVQVASRLWYVTHHDPVTLLPNQTLLNERLELAIHRCARQQAGLTVLLVELDHLRKLRSTFGPPTAELALRIAAERLREASGPEDALACLGGSQFVIVTNETGDGARLLAARIQARLEQWVDVDQNAVALDASIGAVSYPDHGNTPETLLRRAHIALGIAGAAGGGLRFFSSEMDAHARRRNELESLLRVAVHEQAHSQLHLVYQPQVSLANGEIRNAEALLRWRHPSLGAVGPAEFIPIAETAGLILPLGEWVMHTACREASRLLRRCGQLPRISVNVSAQQFARQDVVGMIERALSTHALEPRYLEIEITETVLLGDSSAAVGCLRSLHDLGVEIAVDDFGTGYASLAYLTRFPVHRLKIDQTFVRDMLTHAPSHAIVSAVIAMAHSLGLRVTAEGVETQAQAQRLTELGCDEAQGYWFARPVDIHGFYHIMAPLGSGARR
ncbi:bifunctional diguanylate cyclase/phosphodiesterase [Pandoraea sp. SD6-2]|uniref:putative bifunctional diguanylate cyclase/phosphodiesterase n=1 Tax=Pandoraea sp. SD6-2 TaxID=1286093 RepID=UPI00032F4B75|nr:EAL domain-containing protein [Pandoraea sp. SD6-2]EON14329.1 PAS/PAC sensor-containing diguanylate cyclase/phosphodiesterase [Pandoraea sp. SD6-2]